MQKLNAEKGSFNLSPEDFHNQIRICNFVAIVFNPDTFCRVQYSGVSRVGLLTAGISHKALLNATSLRETKLWAPKSSQGKDCYLIC